jgi:hypothetical protein
MWQKQARQLSVLSKSESEAKKSKGQRSVEEAEKRQERLLKILKKDLETNQRMVVITSFIFTDYFMVFIKWKIQENISREM